MLPVLSAQVWTIFGKRNAKRRKPKRCDCGQLATRLGVCVQLRSCEEGHAMDEMQNAFFVCEECARWADRGVALYPLEPFLINQTERTN